MSYSKPLLIYNADIITMDPQTPRAAAMAVNPADGRIIAVGSGASDVELAIGKFTHPEMLDAKGKTIIPGLIDSHAHFYSAALDTMDIDLANAASESAAAEMIGKMAAATPPGIWITGRHWNQNHWDDKQFPSKYSLDRVAPHHPVLLWTHSQHAVWVNSAALRIAGITRETQDPIGGHIGRGADDEPDGMLFENAVQLITEVYERTRTLDDRTLAAYEQVIQSSLARGLTGSVLMEGRPALKIEQRLLEQGKLQFRFNHYIPADEIDSLTSLGLEGGFGNEWIALTGIKIFSDGALGSRTAATLEPYADSVANYGTLTHTEAELRDYLLRAANNTIGVAIHAIGDKAANTVLNAIESIKIDKPSVLQPLKTVRLEHIQLISRQDIQRMASLRVCGSVQPFHAVSDRETADAVWGTSSSLMYPYASLAKAGVLVTLGSDLPIETNDPWKIISAAVNRNDYRYPQLAPWRTEEALTVQQALAMYTINAAAAADCGSWRGAIRVGYAADFVALEENPLAIPADRIAETQPQAVYVHGAPVFGDLS